jgi:hypothetical protein
MTFLELRIFFLQDRTSERTILIDASCVGGLLDQLCRNALVVDTYNVTVSEPISSRGAFMARHYHVI